MEKVVDCHPVVDFLIARRRHCDARDLEFAERHKVYMLLKLLYRPSLDTSRRSFSFSSPTCSFLPAASQEALLILDPDGTGV